MPSRRRVPNHIREPLRQWIDLQPLKRSFHVVLFICPTHNSQPTTHNSLFDLLLKNLMIKTSTSDQFVVCAALDDAAFFQNEDLIGVLHG